MAEQLSTTSEAELDALVKETERQTTAQIAVVVVNSLEGDDVDTYAHKLFNAWGIGRKDNNNGVLFLVAPYERRTRIEVGYGLEPLITDDLAGQILDNEVIPYFKKDDIEAGIVNGTKEIAAILQKYPEAAKGKAGSAPGFVLTRSRKAVLFSFLAIGAAVILFAFSFYFGKGRSYSGLVFAAGLIVLGGLLFGAWYAFTGLGDPQRGILPLLGAGGTGLVALIQNVRKYRRFRPRMCKKCGTQMNLMDEKKDDLQLEEVERLEESLGSIDYDVWLCPACKNVQEERYISSFSGYSKCPQCKRRTYSEKSQTIVAATYSSSGTAQVTGTCKNCKHTNSYTRTIPRLTRSSSGSSGGSSSGGSFGGGSSGGGGASRGW